MRISKRTVTSIVGLSVAALTGTGLLATPAAASSSDSGSGYPRYQYEGKYPDRTPCNYTKKQQKSVTVGGRTVKLKYYYSGGCGSFARIDNAPRSCRVRLDRTRTSSTRPPFDWVQETVDRGLSYAYTKVGSNLHNRKSRAALMCGANIVKARTSWY